MSSNRILLFFVLSFFAVNSSLVGQINKCGTDKYMQERFYKNTNLEIQKDRSYIDFYESKGKSNPQNRTILTIPVHVIIVHAPGQSVGSGDNLSLEHIQSQIDVMNEDFARTNSDASNTPPEFQVGDTNIRFCLASEDPDGNGTDGVTRYATNLDFDSNDYFIRSETAWSRDDYMNIWVAPNLDYLGLATLASPGWIPNDPISDFIHIVTGAFGGPGYATLSPYNLGRTATHEIGHWLGLQHVWRNSGCAQDDGIADTPLQDDENFNCPNHPSPSCGNSGDMFMNYMDYVDDDCMNAFTIDQGEYMVSVLNGARSSLLFSSGCNYADPLSIDLDYSINPSCYGEENGEIQVSATGGTGLTFEISTGEQNTDGYFDNLPSGFYTVTVFTSSGSFVSLDVELVEPDELLIELDNYGENDCSGNADGFIVVMASGGTGDYTFQLQNGTSNDDGVFTDLEAGNYVVSVFDENDCFNIVEVELVDPSPIEIQGATTISVLCNGSDDGSIEVDASGGTGDLTYSLNGATGQASNLFSNLTAGVYNVAVTDQNDCAKSISVTVTEPSQLVVSFSNKKNVTCNGDENGSITVSGTGGTGGYTYSLDNVNFQSSALFNSLKAGNYTAYVKDENSCTSQKTFSITEPSEIVVTVSVMDASCGQATGIVQLEGSGGASGFTYTLGGISNSTGLFENLMTGSYSTTTTDANGCVVTKEVSIGEIDGVTVQNVSVTNAACASDASGAINVTATGGTGQLSYDLNGMNNTTGVFSDLVPGTYTVQITDQGGCSSTVEATIVGTLAFQNVNVMDVSCFGESDGSVSVEVLGGSGDFTYHLGTMSNTTGDFTGLMAGDYSVDVVDNKNGCTLEQNVSITEPSEITVDVDLTTNQNIGTIEVTATGGNPSYEYSIDGGMNYQSESRFENLSPGEYKVTVRDASGCTNTVEIIILSAEFPDYVEKFSVVPNPVKGNLHIDYILSKTSSITLEVFDMNAKKVVDNNQLYRISGQGSLSVETDILASGLYILKVEFENKTAFIKFLKA
ncbi:MAG: T9SS type A sorting domain-containing protein [Lewinellaceae bacterium]|nr:T9SS type A sorting domain-containing protein [Lewinellaceae bacterium]